MAVLLLAIIWRGAHPAVIRYKNHLAQIKLVGLALKLYADDHQGLLPHRLDDLLPVYFTDQRVLETVEFLVSDQKLPDLPAFAVLARRICNEDKSVAVVHADQGAEARAMR